MSSSSAASSSSARAGSSAGGAGTATQAINGKSRRRRTAGGYRCYRRRVGMERAPEPSMISAPRSRRALLGALAGFLLGAFDYGIMAVTGVAMTMDGNDVSLAVMSLYAASFAALGYALGRLADARAQARRDAATIRGSLSALEESQQRLVQAEKRAAVGRLAAAVAHEVRNPLGVIRSSASLAADGLRPDDHDGRKALGFVVEECDRLNGMITSLLAFARPRPLDLRDVAIADVVRRARALGEVEAGRHGAALSVTSAQDLPAIRGDADLLAQLVFGLIVNAAEAAGGGGRVEVRVKPDGGALAVEVADDGPGVPDEAREALFEPFFSTKDGGTGLGLATAARIAAAHRGRLELVDGAGAGAGGRGACFRLSLPGSAA